MPDQNNGYYSVKELNAFGFVSVGDNVLLSKKASVYQPEKITLGNHVRIDDLCFLAGEITIGNHVHISPYASIHGTGGGTVTLKDYTGIASYSTIFSSSDDLSGEYMANTMIDLKFVRIISRDVIMEKHSIMGVHSVLLPGAYLAEGTVLSSMSQLSKKTQPWSIYFGIPAKKIMPRSKKILSLEKVQRANGELS